MKPNLEVRLCVSRGNPERIKRTKKRDLEAAKKDLRWYGYDVQEFRYWNDVWIETRTVSATAWKKE